MEVIETRPHWRDDERLLREARPFGQWRPHISYAMACVKAGGLYCEFGVHMGGSLAYLLTRTSETFHGFDSFRGLQERWLDFKVGHLDMGGKPSPHMPLDRLVLHIGMFEDTLPAFNAAYPGPISFMHVDCDLYSSTVSIFKHLRERLRKGTVIVFDEYITGTDDERKAFLETGLPFRYLGRHIDGGSVAVQLT